MHDPSSITYAAQVGRVHLILLPLVFPHLIFFAIALQSVVFLMDRR